ncbi:hypothetical protein [Streptomyces olivaceus]|uniref:hypothetical protein n=1 Tax=Streptomyces olivaceus TaxID=47716 RepID=UPI0004CADC77|nr:hypothetical protein [Streptomyces olivaceus]MBZ6102694.1 hypothetical protein [Streptomyces olivaceus]
MGTNYYVQTEPCPTACEHCSASEHIHLGKASAGWRFSFQAQPDWGPLNGFTEWMKLAMSGVITDEYGSAHSLADLLRLIHDRQQLRSHMEPQPDLGVFRADHGWFVSDGHEFSTNDFT